MRWFRNAILCIGLTCMMAFNVSANETLTDQGENFKHLNYVINQNLESTSTKDKNTYYLESKGKVPKLEVYVFKKDMDFSAFNDTVNPNKLRVVFKDFYAKKSIIKDINYEMDELGCIKTNYNIETSNSKSLKANAYIISSEKGLYVINLQTNSEDENDYKWDDFLKDVDVQGLRDYFQQVKEAKEKKQQLKQLKAEIQSISCLTNANSDEKNNFNTQKTNALALIQENASVEDVQAAKSNLEQINTDIQSRLDQEEAARQAAEAQAQAEAAAQAAAQAQAAQAAQAADQTVYYCVDGTNVGNANPHARGRANACYGHGGFAVNH